MSKKSHEPELNKKMVPLEVIARQLEFVERTRIEGLPLDFSKLANENKFKVHKIVQETQFTKSDLQSCLDFKHQFTLNEI